MIQGHILCLNFSDLSDTQDYDLICSKTLRLYNLVSSPDNSLEKFIDNFLSKRSNNLGQLAFCTFHFFLLKVFLGGLFSAPPFHTVFIS